MYCSSMANELDDHIVNRSHVSAQQPLEWLDTDLIVAAQMFHARLLYSL